MIEVKEVKGRRMQKEFLQFPNDLYRNNPSYVPAMWMSEKDLFRDDYIYYETSEAAYFNAYRDGKIVGRIAGIIQRASNEKTGEKRVRFNRFDCIEDFEVAKALFDTVEDWARSKGMELACGPLGFSDLEREGLLVDGFNEPNTFEEQYNAAYYGDFIERLGYAKEVDWLEFRIKAPEPEQEAELKKMADFIMRRYKLHFGESRNGRDFLRKYKDGFFEILDKSYEHIYGTVPFSDNMKKLMISNFNLIIDNKHVAVILDENNKVVLMALCFPSLSKTMQASDGHLYPKALLRFLKDKFRPEIIDLGLIGVDPEWANRGISVCVAAKLAEMLRQKGTLYAESNLNLENNHAIINLWHRFNYEQVKRRRSYIKKLI
ncbi:MAG: hypothetical protein MJY57_05350 [Bacteroidales bacterium]|nr:hypothetical protein [Bacteroidales bacterium]